MDIKEYISIKQFCESYGVPEPFINSLHDFELIEIVSIKKKSYVSMKQLHVLEKLITFHYDLNINMEGMHAISNLLNTIDHLQRELKELKNRLDFYESGFN